MMDLEPSWSGGPGGPPASPVPLSPQVTPSHADTSAGGPAPPGYLEETPSPPFHGDTSAGGPAPPPLPPPRPPPDSEGPWRPPPPEEPPILLPSHQDVDWPLPRGLGDEEGPAVRLRLDSEGDGDPQIHVNIENDQLVRR